MVWRKYHRLAHRQLRCFILLLDILGDYLRRFDIRLYRLLILKWNMNSKDNRSLLWLSNYVGDYLGDMESSYIDWNDGRHGLMLVIQPLIVELELNSVRYSHIFSVRSWARASHHVFQGVSEITT